MSSNLAKDLKRAIEAELFALLRNRTEDPIYINDWQPKRGGWVVTLESEDLQPQGDRLIKIINDRIRVQGQRFKADWNYNLPKHAIMTARFTSSGNPQELLEDPDIGVVRMNRWPEHLQGKIRFLKIKNEEGSQCRLARFEGPEELVQLIKAKQGLMRVGFENATVHSGKKLMQGDSPVVYRLQK